MNPAAAVVAGVGSWGVAPALALVRKPCRTYLWERDAARPLPTGPAPPLSAVAARPAPRRHGVEGSR